MGIAIENDIDCPLGSTQLNNLRIAGYEIHIYKVAQTAQLDQMSHLIYVDS